MRALLLKTINETPARMETLVSIQTFSSDFILYFSLHLDF